MLKSRFIILCQIVVCLILAVSCSDRPDDVASDKDMASVLADMHLAESYIEMNMSEFPDDSSRKVLQQSILQRHNMSRREFVRSIDWYGHNMDKYVVLYDEVESILIAKESGLRGKTHGMEDVGESLFPMPAMRRISRADASDGIYFSYPVSSLEKGCRFALHMKLTEYSNKINILFGVEYADGANSYTFQKKMQGGRYDIYLQTDSTVSAKRVYGHIRFPEMGATPVWVDSLAITSEPLDASSYRQINNQRYFPASIRRTHVETEDSGQQMNQNTHESNVFGETSVSMR